MPLTRTILWLSLLSMSGCGPRAGDRTDWMMDTFSEFPDGAGQAFTFTGLSKLTFERDGVGERTRIGECGRDVSETPFSWERREDGAIAIVPESGEDYVFDSSDEEWRLFPADRCRSLQGLEEINLQEIHDGEVALERKFYRGDLCLEHVECSDTEGDSQCDSCRTVWCDEAPAPCKGS
jgi:hypothetical protein